MNNYHKYLILPDKPNASNNQHRVIIFNEEADIDELFMNAGFDILSAGKVKFVKSVFGGEMEPDIVHGNLLLGIQVNLERAEIDKKLIQEYILD